jgi:hypothetical protein
MKYILVIVTTFFCFAFSSCSKKYAALENGNYYNIIRNNFINKWYVTNDSIIIVKVNFNLPKVGGAGDTIAAVKIYDVIKNGNTYNLYIDQIGNKALQKQFSILAIKKNKNEILFTTGNKFFTSLAECKKQKFKNPENDFCFSLYTQQALDSFRQFRNIKDLDTATVCEVIKNFRNLAEINREKVEKIAKYDMYLSASTKELMNRTLIGMQINPMEYTGDESNEMLKKCNKLLHD